MRSIARFTVTRESHRLNSIITDFLAYSHAKQYRFAQVDMVPLLEDTLTLLERRLEVQKIGIKIERKYCAPQASGPRRWRSHEAGLLEFLRERHPGNEAGRHADDKY